MTNKNRKAGTVFLLILVMSLLGLTYFFNLYPGGYSYKESGGEVVIEQGVWHKKSLHFAVTNDRELQLALLGSTINHLKTTWTICILTMATFLLTASHFFQQKKRFPFIFLMAISFVIFILLINSYMDGMHTIAHILESLQG